MDGLLLDTERQSRDAFAAACGERGFRMDMAVYQRCIGSTWEEGRRILQAGFGPQFPLAAIEVRWAELYADIQSMHGVALRPGARELLEALHVWGVPTALVTSTARGVAGVQLHLTRLNPFFRARVCGGETRRGKPAPEPYLLAAKVLGVDERQCLVLEDSPNGVRAGVAAGMRVVQVPDLVPPDAQLRELGHTVHRSLLETLEMLRASQRRDDAFD